MCRMARGKAFEKTASRPATRARLYSNWSIGESHAYDMTATNVDVEQYPMTRDDFNDQTVPTTVTLKNGEELFRLVGAKT
jgi:hypothetical protein